MHAHVPFRHGHRRQRQLPVRQSPARRRKQELPSGQRATNRGPPLAINTLTHGLAFPPLIACYRLCPPVACQYLGYQSLHG